VPSTIESGVQDANLDFYDETNRMEYSLGNGVQVIENAYCYRAPGGDCSVYRGNEEYVPCANVAVDLWSPKTWAPAVESGAGEATKRMSKYHSTSRILLLLDCSQILLIYNFFIYCHQTVIGIIGNQNWFITQNTIKMEPSLSSYHRFQFQGRDNRRKLAETFKRPTTWKDYCLYVSENNCTTDNGVAAGPPAQDESEDDKYFVAGVYILVTFVPRKRTIAISTPQLVPDYPCGWVSFMHI
jgi:hypothetical protein